ncbi:MAG: hypothetical protein J7497_02105, partial [Chitinophagaceae bacterium]|nr:hypothetical protein [Chitinophagaceae bacterium]
SFSQEKQFAGTWVLKDYKSVTGFMYENIAPKKILVSSYKDRFEVIRVTPGVNNMDVESYEILYFNGKPFQTITPSKRKKSTSMKYSTGHLSFAVVALLKNAIDSKVLDIKITEGWQLSEGNMLRLTRKSEDYLTGEIWEVEAFYEHSSNAH